MATVIKGVRIKRHFVGDLAGYKKKKVKEHTKFDDVLQYLKKIIEFVALKETRDEAEDVQ